MYQDAVERKDKIMQAMLKDCEYYADGEGTNQNESLHHVRLPFIGRKFKHFKNIASRIHEADLKWNEGPQYVIEAFRRQNILLSNDAEAFFQRLAKEEEQQRMLNLTQKRKKYLRDRKNFIRKRARAVQARDDDEYVGHGQGDLGKDEMDKLKRKRKRNIITTG